MFGLQDRLQVPCHGDQHPSARATDEIPGTHGVASRRMSAAAARMAIPAAPIRLAS